MFRRDGSIKGQAAMPARQAIGRNMQATLESAGSIQVELQLSSHLPSQSKDEFHPPAHEAFHCLKASAAELGISVVLSF
jgi:hypothetical protein